MEDNTTIREPGAARHVRWVFHPIVFAIYPIVFLYTFNEGHVNVNQLLRPLAVVGVMVVVLWGACQVWLRDGVKSGIATTVCLFLFFSFGHALPMLPDTWSLFVRYVILLTAWLAVTVGCFWWIRRASRDLVGLSNRLNLVGLMLVAVTGFSGHLSIASSETAVARLADRAEWEAQSRTASQPERLPDIYYIMLDGYASQDVLRDVFQYDNSDFVEFLRREQFVVAEHARANYCQTWLSLTASLNLAYVDDVLNIDDIAPHDRQPLRHMIQHSRVVKFLRQFGYRFVSFESGKEFTEMETADLVLPSRPVVDEFMMTWLRSTPLVGFAYVSRTVLGAEQAPLPEGSYQAHRDRIHYTLEHLSRIPPSEAPQFVFAHILAPHPPFVFDADGTPIQPEREFYTGDGSAFMEQGGTVEEYHRNYQRQLAYLNMRLTQTIGNILAGAPEPPVIVVQADHGSRMRLDWSDPGQSDLREAFSIFSAVYLPGIVADSTLDAISPVNTFRVILNAYFETQFPILENKSYYSTWEHPYRFVDVDDHVI